MSYRPTIAGTPRTNRIHVRLTDEEHADLTAKATALGVTISDLIRRIAGLPTANVSEARRDAARAKRGVPRTGGDLEPATEREPALAAASPAPIQSQPAPAPNPEPAPFVPPWGRR
jgi:hypothetical protein